MSNKGLGQVVCCKTMSLERGLNKIVGFEDKELLENLVDIIVWLTSIKEKGKNWYGDYQIFGSIEEYKSLMTKKWNVASLLAMICSATLDQIGALN